MKVFPTIAIADSPLNVEVNKLLAELAGSPILQKESSPVDVAEMAATRLATRLAKQNGTKLDVELAKLRPETAPAPAAAVSPQPAVTTTPAKAIVTPAKVPVASGAAGTRAPDQPLSEADRFKAVSQIADPREQEAELNKLLYSQTAA